jgi:hypothetical protein
MAGRRLDTTGLTFQGDGFRADSFCLAVQAAAQLVGRKIEYDLLLAVTGNAFAPGFDTGNDWKELWVAEAWVSHIGVPPEAWEELGLAVEPVSLPPAVAGGKNPDAERDRHRACARILAAAMAEGKVVVTTGGWAFKDWRRQPEPWWAGIVTEVAEDGTVRGAHLNGRTDNELAGLAQGELLSVRPLAATAEGVATLPVLRTALARIRAQGPFRRGAYTAFGLDAMDDWIQQMRSVPYFCPECQKTKKAGWHSATIVADAAAHRSRAAANYLRRQRNAMPRAAAAIDGAAGHYDRIVQLLAPCVTGNGGPQYRDFIGDLAAQLAHAETVLVPVKNELAGAATQIEEALAITG